MRIVFNCVKLTHRTSVGRVPPRYCKILVMRVNSLRKPFGPLVVAAALSACGGGGGGGGGTTTAPPQPTSDFDRGVFSDADEYAAICANPRGPGFPDVSGSATDENEWLRAWSHDLYLWYDEIVDEDPRDFTTPRYFDLMKTFELTPNGTEKDSFHFSLDTEVWEQEVQTGTSVSYGMSITLLSASPPREAVVAYVQPEGPADDPGNDIRRGTRIVTADGVDVAEGFDTDTLNDALFPQEEGEVHTFEVEDFDGSNRREVTLTAGVITEDFVPLANVVDSSIGPVGYMIFNRHRAPAEARLVQEIEAFAAAGIEELILDLRYNGGGLLDIASQLAFMIAGSAASGQVFEVIEFNDKHPEVDPVTGRTIEPGIFIERTLGYSLASGSALPRLNLPRVFILSGEGTCSASETIINGLRGIDVEVVLIGETTCGKPYGFYPFDNCGTTYFSTQLRTSNAKGFGDYTDGFIPTDDPVEAFEVPGCVIPDDFGAQLGDTNEAKLQAALTYIETGSCPTEVMAAAGSRVGISKLAEKSAAATVDTGATLRDPLRFPGVVLSPR